MKSEEDYDTRGLHADYDIEIYSLFARHRQCVCSSIIRQHKHSNKASKRPKQVYSCLEGVHFHDTARPRFFELQGSMLFGSKTRVIQEIE